MQADVFGWLHAHVFSLLKVFWKKPNLQRLLGTEAAEAEGTRTFFSSEAFLVGVGVGAWGGGCLTVTGCLHLAGGSPGP